MSFIEIAGGLIGFVISFCILVLPVIIVAINAINLFAFKSKGKRLSKLYQKRRRYTSDSLVLETLLVVFSSPVMGFGQDWDAPVVLNSVNSRHHTPFSTEYLAAFIIVSAAALVCLFLLNKERIRPPLVAVLLVSGMYIGILFSLLVIIQLCAGLPRIPDDPALLLLPYYILYCLNYIICAVRVVRDTIVMYADYFRGHDVFLGGFLSGILNRATGWIWFPLLGIIPVTGLLAVVFILCGQSAFGAIRAFTETADWTFSTKIPPPPVEYSGHYLCTVAVNGHEKLVKPTRLGIRQGVKIGVNRQLCVANAFEQLISDRTPRLHKAVRSAYDKYGYPLSKKITTKLRADIVYILMKPLEWMFVIVLYLFDTDPESRIAVQYTGKTLRDFT